ncbi:MAG: prolyl oligopeptidase family serine peptidase [Lactobacillaceae bacterium]|jgi:acylaminoacyl-peptidase|nr:prolyl oligopeptidase family serine peptidase [Lactobacillaceae bacterium]
MLATNKTLYDIRALANPLVLNDRVYVQVSRAREAENDYITDLIEVVDGQAIVKVADVQQVQASDEQLFYVQAGQLFEFVDGGDDIKLTDVTGKLEQFQPTPDGAAIFYRTQHSDQADFNTVADQPAVRRYTHLHYKDDGKGFIDEARYFELHRLTNGEDELIQTEQHPFAIADVLDADNVLLITQITDDDALYTYHQLAQYTVSTDKHMVLSHDGLADIEEAIYSPDGGNVLFIARDKQRPFRRVAELFNFNFETNSIERVYADEALLDGPNSDVVVQAQQRHVKWLDAENFAFQTGHRGHNRLYFGSIFGEMTLVRDNREALLGFEFVGDIALVVSSTAQHPAQLIDLVTQNVVLDLNETYQDHEKFVFLSENGDVVDAWFMPNALQAQAPVVLYVHGGPHGAYGDTFFLEFQQFSAAGYNVVFINPHGSTTYGQDFVDAVVKHYGEQDYRDLLTGLDAALTQHPDLIDASQQYIVGGSYGGFMATWAIGQSDRFKAAVAQRPVTNWLDLFGASDIGYNFVFEEMGATPFDERGRATLTEKSPLTYVQYVKTPLLLMQGEYDMRTPAAQSEHYFTAMKMLSTAPVEMVRFPQAWHGVSRNGLPNLRLARLDVMFDWLHRY